MGLFSKQKALLETVGAVNPGSGLGAAKLGIRTPFGSGALTAVAWNDIFGGAAHFISREDAMSVPAVAKARNLLVSLLAGAPLVELDSDTDTLSGVQSEFLYRTDGLLSPWHRMCWTLDDLAFYGWSLWANVVRNEAGKILSAERVPVERWRINDDGYVEIDGDVQRDETAYILIPGPHEGLLSMAARSVRGMLFLEQSWLDKAKNPVPVAELHETAETGMEADEAQLYVDAYVAARQDPNGVVAFTPYNIELRTHGEAAVELFIEGRNFARIDVAGFFGFPAAALDGSLSTASLTYSTQEGKRNELADYATPLWRGAIEGRLSQDDVVIPGNRVRFDLGDLRTTTPNPTGPTVKD